MDCIWCGEEIAPVDDYVSEDGDGFHASCFDQYQEAIEQLRNIYRNPVDDLEVFIDGGMET